MRHEGFSFYVPKQSDEGADTDPNMIFAGLMRFYSTGRKLYWDLNFANLLATNMLILNFVYYRF